MARIIGTTVTIRFNENENSNDAPDLPETQNEIEEKQLELNGRSNDLMKMF